MVGAEAEAQRVLGEREARERLPCGGAGAATSCPGRPLFAALSGRGQAGRQLGGRQEKLSGDLWAQKLLLRLSVSPTT